MMGTSKNKQAGIKPHLLKVLLAAVFVLGLTIFVNSTDVQAGTKATISQVYDGVENGTVYATIRFNVTAGENISYRISSAKTTVTNAQAKSIGVAPATGNTNYNITTGLAAGKSYWIQIGSQSYADSSPTWSEPFEIVTAPSAKPTKLKQTKATTTSITASWSASTGANMYLVSTLKAGTTTWSADKTATTNKIVLTGLKQAAAYGIEVTPARKSTTGDKYVAYNRSYAAYSSKYYPTITKKPTAPVLTAGYKQTGKAYVGVKPQSYVTGYQFQIYDMSTKKTVVTSSITTGGKYKKTISSSKLKQNHIYGVRVRSYVVSTSYHSQWSAYSYFASQKNGTLSASRAVNGIKLSWSKVGGAKKYAVYVSTSLNGTYKKVATTSKTSYTITKYGSTALKSGTKYYYYVAPVAAGGKSTNKNMLYAWSGVYY